jgi:hypothetical protein
MYAVGCSFCSPLPLPGFGLSSPASYPPPCRELASPPPHLPNPPCAPVGGATCWLVQTIVRRLKHWQTRDPALNPFIEVGEDGRSVGYSAFSTTPSNASPKPQVQPEDLVIPGPSKGHGGEEVPPAFTHALAKALGLTDADLDKLKGTAPTKASPFVASTLCAVRGLEGELLLVACCLLLLL